MPGWLPSIDGLERIKITALIRNRMSGGTITFDGRESY